MTLNNRDEVCTRFNNIGWHDSRVVGLHLIPRIEYEVHDFCVDVRLLKGDAPANEGYQDAKLLFRDCRIVQLDLDLLGMQLCGGDISTAFCESDAASHEQAERDRLQNFDLPQEEDSLNSFFYFKILLIHPSGEINVYAKDYELQLVSPSGRKTEGL
jgi:hypothetical protein